MRRIVVLEGPDFAGKSTLAARLQPTAAVVILANGPPPAGDLAQHYADQIARARRSLSSTVFDRLHVGELIYGPEFRGTSRLTDQDLLALETMLDEASAIRVHVDASDETLLRRFRGPRGAESRGIEEARLVRSRGFRRLANRARDASAFEERLHHDLEVFGRCYEHDDALQPVGDGGHRLPEPVDFSARRLAMVFVVTGHDISY